MPSDRGMSHAEILSALENLPGWTYNEGKLHKQFTFRDFAFAFGFMAAAAPTIEKRDHHPEWTNVYNKVTVDLVTHDAGGITKRDVDLAALLEDIASRLQ